MADYTFFFNPISRAQIARWALHEAAADYDPVLVPWENKPPELLAANPMGKLPTIIHHAPYGDRVVTEAAAICHYLAEYTAPHLLPTEEERADYFRWMFFAAGPLEAAIITHAFGWNPSEKQQMTAGFGSYDRAVDTLEGWFDRHDYVCGVRFTMADVYVGAQVDWGLAFGTLPARDSFDAYAQRLRGRDAYKDAHAVDMQLADQMRRQSQ
jgi:glutathione S-transferase